MLLLETHIVPENTAKTRLSDYIAFVRIPSRKGMKKAIRRKEVFVDGVAAETAHWVLSGQKITLMQPDLKPTKYYEIPLDILLEDDHFAVVNKPAGLVVSGNQFRTLENALPHNLHPSNLPDALLQARPVHRLDGPTSGLLLVAKTQSALIDLSRQFENKEVQKCYQAIVVGKMEQEGFLNTPIDGKRAVTKFRLIRSVRSLINGWISLVELYPETGRTHQLRIHLSSIGHPIMGDQLYGEKGKILWKKGLFLSALGLKFTHPGKKEKVTIQGKLPSKFERLLEREERWFQLKSSIS